MITVKVPATSANMGSGFDSIGVALALYNTVSAKETDGGLKIDILDDSRGFLPSDSRNLVYRAMQAVFNEAAYSCKGLHIVQSNSIPVTRGMGSSSASIVAGILLANAICKGGMTREDVIALAANIEGHPDNTTPAILGGMVVAVIDGGKTFYQKVAVDSEKIKFAVFVPDFILRTKKARSLLPANVPHVDAVFNTGRAALLVASMMTGAYGNLKTAMDDRLHQQYRRHLIRGMDDIFKAAEDFGAYGAYISGAGPAIIAVIDAGDSEVFSQRAGEFLSHTLKGWNLLILDPDNTGANIE